MRKPASFARAGLLAVIAAGWLVTTDANGNGGKAKMLQLEASIPMAGGGRCHFVAQIDPTLFNLLTLKDRYKVVRIRVSNESGQRLALSRQADSIEVTSDGRKIAGIISLAERDAPLWDGFSPEMRKALVYPQAVEAREEESLFVYLPAADAPGLPSVMVLRLAGVESPIRLAELVAAAKS